LNLKILTAYSKEGTTQTSSEDLKLLLNADSIAIIEQAAKWVRDAQIAFESAAISFIKQSENFQSEIKKSEETAKSARNTSSATLAKLEFIHNSDSDFIKIAEKYVTAANGYFDAASQLSKLAQKADITKDERIALSKAAHDTRKTSETAEKDFNKIKVDEQIKRDKSRVIFAKNAATTKPISVTVGTTTFIDPGTLDSDYARLQLLSQNGGLINIFGHYTRVIPSDCKKNALVKNRIESADRYYPDIRDKIDKGIQLDDSFLFFWSNGLGIKGIRPQISGGSILPTAQIYVGFGYDGPLYSSTDSSSATPPGFLSGEFRIFGNAQNPTLLNRAFGTTNAPTKFWGASFIATLSLPGSFYINLSHTKSFGEYSRLNIKEISTVSFGFRAEAKK
jgi:hypothetical protein